MKLNDNFQKLAKNYLFSEVAARIARFKEGNPGVDVIRMDIGDVTRPLPKAVISAMHEAADEMASSATFRGYGPEQGYQFLREAIAANTLDTDGNPVYDPDDIFISDGAKSDVGNLVDLFGSDARVALMDPGYPVYYDSNVMAGREVEWMECRPENGFRPSLPQERPDVVYLCFPNNPTGVALTRDELQRWVDYANEVQAVIIFDSAYNAYVRSADVPRSVYEVPGAERCAIEVCSFSKSAGFTGMRLGYTVVPKTLAGFFSDGAPASLHDMWRRRQCTKFNGASYVVQRAAMGLFTPEGRAEAEASVRLYLENAGKLRDCFAAMGWQVTGGVDSPYVWALDPRGRDSWDIFQRVLEDCHVSVTPGSGFGDRGRGCIRLTGFNTAANTELAIDRFRKNFK